MYLIKYSAHCHPDVIVRLDSPLQTRKYSEDVVFIAFFLVVSSTHDTFIKEKSLVLWGGAIVESVSFFVQIGFFWVKKQGVS